MLHLILSRARVYAYTYNMLHEPFTLFTPLWNGRFLHLHQNICNNHCNTATKAYHTMNQRAMVADYLQRKMVICHTTVTDVADGFQRICHRNALIFKCMESRYRCVCDSIWKFSILSSRGALRRRISCASTLSFIALSSRDPSLRSGWQTKTYTTMATMVNGVKG